MTNSNLSWKKAIFKKTQDQRPHTFYLEITNKCNMNCPMCITDHHKTSNFESRLNASQIKNKLLIHGKKLNINRLVITGGEPTLVEHLIETINNAVDLDYTVFLASNLLKVNLAIFKKIFFLLDDPKHTIQSSFDSIIKDEMNFIRGGRVYDQIVENYQTILDLKNEMSAKTTFCSSLVLQEENIDSVHNTIDYLLSKKGLDRVVITARHDYSNITIKNYKKPPFPKYSPSFKNKLLKTVKQLYDRSEQDQRIEMVGRGIENWINFYTDPLKIEDICASSAQLFVDAFGNYRGCLHTKPCGNLLTTDPESLLKSKSYKDFLRFNEIFKICIQGCS